MFCSQPIYPELAIQNNWKGIVHLKIELSNSGSVNQVSVLSSSGYDVLDKTAVDMANKWLFTQSNEPTRTVIFSIQFILF